ncbi:hypothetical protein KSP40_PGU014669 [Platanthera guangdongensis]|uniref:Enhancer of polycomb-like protein n=1 Tax=Platanthera guangdongensis TaxID=2320717 RepID=A0ABR2MZ82_9ASPA
MRSENQCEAEEIGSRVFFLPIPPDEPMLTFRRRSSTRVYVAKKAIGDKQPGRVNYLTRVLRSGKRLCLSEPTEKTENDISGDLAGFRWLERNENEERRLDEPFVRESDGNAMTARAVRGPGKMFVNFYSRKRRRNPSWVGLDSSSSSGRRETYDPRFKVVFSRKLKNTKPDVVNDFDKVKGCHFGETKDFFRKSKSQLLEAINVNQGELWTSFRDPLVLGVVSKSSCDDSLLKFHRFLLSIIIWMRRTKMNLHYFAAFLFSDPMFYTFLQRGILFLPVANHNKSFLLGSSISNFGTCKIYSSCESLPLICLNFLALPSYFKSLQFAALLGSRFLYFSPSTYPMSLNKKLNSDTQFEVCDSHVHLETNFLGAALSSSVISTVDKKAPISFQTYELDAQSTGRLRGSRLRKLQRKRNFLKVSSARKFSSMKRGRYIDDSFNFHSNGVRSTGVTKKNLGGQTKEMKAALSDIKLNIDSVQCNANILVTAGDRCWREKRAVVLLELSSSGEWCLAVKIGSNLRYIHRPRDMKYTLNRFTHAHMWIAEDCWRLEFSERLDWLIFKELHTECRQRNNHPKEDVSAKVIPIPVFRDVPAYEDDRVGSFERPEQYIPMKHDDEILRASLSEAPYYDMDSEDEEWLQKHNSCTSPVLLEDSFERMIFTFEKNAYCSSSNGISLERESNNHEKLGSKDTVADVYDYWLKKKKRKRAPLVRVFQWRVDPAGGNGVFEAEGEVAAPNGAFMGVSQGGRVETEQTPSKVHLFTLLPAAFAQNGAAKRPNKYNLK